MTPYAPNDPDTGNATAHEILGEAMRVFAEHPIVPQDLSCCTRLQDATEHIQIMLNTLDLEELSRVWSTFSQPFRLSVLYEVSVVQLDMLGERPMAKRVERVGVPRHPGALSSACGGTYRAFEWPGGYGYHRARSTSLGLAGFCDHYGTDVNTARAHRRYVSGAPARGSPRGIS